MAAWTCQRQAGGVRCRHRNPPRARKCAECNKPRPKRRKPAHMKVLDSMSYERAVELFGERCGICGRRRKRGERRLHRDHEHKTNGRVRGLLCFRCNTALRGYMDAAWLRNAAAYLDRNGEVS